MVSDFPCTVAVAVLIRALELLVAVAVGTGVLVLVLPVLVEPPQAATTIANKRTMEMGIVRLRYIIFLVSPR